jgi:hypothetical protein
VKEWRKVLSGTIKWPQVNLRSIYWPEKHVLFSPDHALEAVPEANCCGATMIESCSSTFVEQNAQKFSLIGQDYWVMPFLKYALWKHKMAKAANLWVKLQHMNPSKKTSRPG